MQRDYASQPEEKTQNRTEQVCSRIVNREGFRPLHPDFRALLIYEESGSVAIDKMERTVRQMIHAQDRVTLRALPVKKDLMWNRILKCPQPDVNIRGPRYQARSE